MFPTDCERSLVPHFLWALSASEQFAKAAILIWNRNAGDKLSGKGGTVLLKAHRQRESNSPFPIFAQFECEGTNRLAV